MTIYLYGVFHLNKLSDFHSLCESNSHAASENMLK